MKNLSLRKFTVLACVIIPVALAFSGLKTSAGQSENTIYDRDPNHLWNRLNEALFIRTAPDGKKYGSDELDILYWFRTKNLLVEPSRQKALDVLDEFINKHGEKLIRDPLNRALLQRDLWQLFDWSATPFGKELEPRRELQIRLAVAIRNLALTTNEIALLPDNYSAEKTKNIPELPGGVFGTNSDWVNVGINSYSVPTAEAHAQAFSGRSTFLVMLNHPDGRQAAIDYLKRLHSFKPLWVYGTNINFPNEPEQNPDLPQFPANTQWALVRRMNVIDTEGRIQPTRLVESIQVRTYLEVSKLSANPKQTQRFEEFQISRKPIAALRKVEQGEKGFRQFFSKGFDPFDHQPSEFQMEKLKSCVECHFGAGIHSVNTFSRRFSGVSSVYTTPIVESKPEHESRVTIEWKQTQYNWGLLQGFWLSRK